ncbi:hypothetical protein TWF481_006158 [Arthrobotrys musiformis]|uniref:Uncharacterized protein n=1 Tax=Arthrobotrys musiformis TaxID=47236 RepID=A0AAV9WGV7_9PEZI
MPPTNIRFLLVLILSATTIFAFVSGLNILPLSVEQQQHQQEAKFPLVKQARENLLTSVQRPIGKWLQNTFTTTATEEEGLGEGVAIVDWKSYVDANKFHYAVHNWESLKDDQEMLEKYGVNGPSKEDMPRILCLIDSSDSDSGDQNIRTSECTWEEVHDPNPSQRWHIRYKYLSGDPKVQGGPPVWLATIRNARTESCIKSDYGIERGPTTSRRDTYTAGAFRIGRVSSTQCRGTSEEAKGGLEFIIQRCANNQTPSNDAVETDQLFRNWSLCIHPPYDSVDMLAEDERPPQNICSAPGRPENLVHALDKPSAVEWGCGSNTWYFPTQALSVEKQGPEWKRL